MHAKAAQSPGNSLFAASPDAPAGPVRLARVVVERGIDEVGVRDLGDHGLTYRCDDPDLRVGERVTVPLGRGDTAVGGVIVAVGGAELAGSVPLARIKPITSRDGAALTPDLLELARWMSVYYVCPLGMVLGAMLPAAVKQGIGKRSRLVLEPAWDAAAEPPPLKKAAAAAFELARSLAPDAWPAEPRTLATRLGLRTVGPVNQLVAAGLLRAASVSDIRARRAALPTGDFASPPADTLTLTDDQARALDGIGARLGSFSTHLLHGITGSGKTEVYLRLIDRVLAADPDSGVIVLVPEIALTPQTSDRFRARHVAAGVVTLHSGLSSAERHREWAALARGRSRVVIGARSAVFAPLARVGLIIVDEEHDGSYKQDQLPRYHARDAAIKRAQLAGCPVVLGSATPSLESLANAAARPARSTLWTLSTRAGGGVLPDVRIVDLATEARADRALAAGAMLGPTLVGAIGRTLREGGQVILLHNRRGYASVVACPDRTCGWTMRCTTCSVAMVFHKSDALRAGGLLRCHHCLAEQRRPDACPECGKRPRSLGAGTQRLEEELASRFAGAEYAGGMEEGRTFLRVDSDTMRSATDYFAALSRFSRGELRVLLGTQMIAKGLDFPNVRLVGVVNADLGLSIPDFRAPERVCQLVCQVAGRAGRADGLGRVVVQTYSSDAACLQFARSHDYAGFAREELLVRAAAGLPPSSRMARIVCRDPEEPKARRDAEDLAAALSDAIAASGSPVRLAGPMVCPIERINDHWRYELTLTGAGPGAVQSVLAAVRARGLLTSDHRHAVDVDPVSML